MRPGATNLNRATGASSSDRLNAAPGLSVQAPIGVNVGPNSLQGLAEILGVGANIAMSEAERAREQRRREREEDEAFAATAQAEADVWEEKVDTQRLKEDRIYARRVKTLSGTRQALEASEKLKADFADWRKENPLADEKEARQWIKEWTDSALVDENGQPIAALADPIQEAIIRQQLGSTSFTLVTADREVFRANVKSAGTAEAGGAFLSAIRQNKGVKLEDYEALRTSLRGIGYTVEEANAEIAKWAVAAAEALESPDPISLVPSQWADGSSGPIADPDTLRVLDSQRDLFTARQQAAAMKALEPLRLQFRLQMEDKAARGEDPTAEDMERGLQLGLDDSTIAGYFGKARTERRRQLEEAEREAREAERHEETIRALEGSPWSVDQSKAEDAYTREYEAAGSWEEKKAVIKRAIDQRGVLPGRYRNWMNRIPNSPGMLTSWASNMKWVRSLDGQVYASLKEDARMHYEAYEALKASGKYNDTQAFERLQVRDAKAGDDLLGTDAAQELIEELVGEDATPHDRRNAERIIKTFGTFSDLPRSEALALAEASYKATYFRTEGVSYHKGFMKDPERVTWTREFFARELAKRGTRVDADDLIITPVGNGKMFTVRERGGVRPLTPPVSADLLQRGFIASEREDIRRKYGDAALGAAMKTLAGDPAFKQGAYRHVYGETGPERSQRIQLETQALNALKRLEQRK